MSHSIAKSIKWVGDGAELLEADSNTRIITCKGRESLDFYHYKWETTLREFFEYLLGGMIRPNISANGYKWSYAVLHLAGEIEPWWETWEKVKDDPKKFEWFRNYVLGKTTEPKGKYVIKLNGPEHPNWIAKITKKHAWRTHTKAVAKAFPYHKACVLAKIAEQRFYKGLFNVEVVPYL